MQWEQGKGDGEVKGEERNKKERWWQEGKGNEERRGDEDENEE